MSLKDYVILAAVLKSEQPARHWLNKHCQWRLTVVAFARALLEDNPRFNADRFFTAVGYEGEPS